MELNPTQKFSENLYTKLSYAGWRLTYGSWEVNYKQKIGQEMVLEDDSRLIIVSYPNIFYTGLNSNHHISLLINNKVQKKYVEFGFDFKDDNELDKSLDLLILKQNSLSVDNCCDLITDLLKNKMSLMWESQGQILEEISDNNIHSNKFIIPQ
jgi:hypothetical protein